MSTADSSSNLLQAARDLSSQWEQTKVFWSDIKRREFGEKYIDVMPFHVERAAAVLEELNGLLKKVRSECE
jgi:hypothetical protein